MHLNIAEPQAPPPLSLMFFRSLRVKLILISLFQHLSHLSQQSSIASHASTSLASINKEPVPQVTMLRSRAVPILATAAMGGGIYWQTRGGRNQPAGRTTGEQYPISESLQSMAGSGGKHTREQPSNIEWNHRDTKILSHSTTTPTKRVGPEARD